MLKRLMALGLVLTVSLAFAGCGEKKPDVKPEDPAFNEKVAPAESEKKDAPAEEPTDSEKKDAEESDD